MDAVETIEYQGYTIKIIPDQCDESPRDWDNLTEFHCCHGKYRLGDEGKNYTSGEAACEAAKEAEKNNDIVLPLYIYDHSGVALSLHRTGQFADQWDSGQLGFVIIRRKAALDEYSRTRMSEKLRNHLIKIAEAEVATYNQFLCGDVYGYQVTNKDGEDIDSCWGYYGTKYAIQEAKSVVEHTIEQNRKAHQQKLKAQIKSNAPIRVREPLKT